MSPPAVLFKSVTCGKCQREVLIEFTITKLGMQKVTKTCPHCIAKLTVEITVVVSPVETRWRPL